MVDRDNIPPATIEAYDDLLATGIAQIVEELRLTTNSHYSGDAEFLCQVNVPTPNQAGLPAKVKLRIVIPATFPLTSIDVYPVEETVRGFPHQDAETGKLCLQPSSSAPWNVMRLKCYIEWATEWLLDAAQGTLLAPGQPYELPDFSRKYVKLPSNAPLFFDESSTSYQVWKPWIGFNGVVKLKMLKAPLALVPVSFCLPNGNSDVKTSYSDSLLETRVLHGRWLLLPDIRALRHRPPQTYEEFVKLCQKVDINFTDVLYRAWSEDNVGFDCGMLLVGFPIPILVGQQPKEIHWQALVFETWKQDKKYKAFKKQSRRLLFENVTRGGNFTPSSSLLWVESRNITSERLYARGGCEDFLRTLKTTVCGCGALGSMVCELLVRGGVSHTTILDKEEVEIGNLCRHTLDGVDVRCSKAIALARKLSTTNPLANIKGYNVSLPLPPKIPKQLDMVHDRLLDTDLLIDCTTDEGAFIWLNEFARIHRKRLVSLFFNFNATVLTLCISGKHTPCAKVCRKLYQDICSRKTPISNDEWDRKPTSDEIVIPGAGCWHPTFPAANRHVWMLAAAAVDAMNQFVPNPLQTDGLGVLIRRNDIVNDDILVKPILEIAWIKKYR